MEEASLSFLPLESALEESPSLPDVPEVQFIDGDTKEIVRAVNSQPADIVVELIKKHCRN